MTKKQIKVLNDKNRFKLLITGRRGGKTFIGSVECFQKAIENTNFAVSIWNLSDSAVRRQNYAEIIKMIPERAIHKGRSSLSSPARIALRNGSFIDMYGGGGDVQKKRGAGYNHIQLDECQDQKKSLWEEILRPMLATSRGTATLTGTAKGKFNWTYDLSQSKEFSFHNYSTNEMGIVHPEEIESLRRTMDSRTFEQEILGKIVDFVGEAYCEYNSSCYANIPFGITYDTVLTFDFNVNPMTCTVLQHYDVNRWVATKEFTLYNSNTWEMSETVRNWLQISGFIGNLQVTGDWSGMQMRSSSTMNDWRIIEDYFKNFRGYARKIKVVRNIRDRINALNTAFKNKNIVVNNEICKDLDRDLKMVSIKEDGSLENYNNKQTHWSDNLSYFAYNYFPIEALFSKPAEVW